MRTRQLKDQSLWFEIEDPAAPAKLSARQVRGVFVDVAG